MKIIVCVDEQNGIMFHGRRLSSDRGLTSRILDKVDTSSLWVTPYSAKLFEGAPVCVDPSMLKKAKQEDFCFIEDADILPYMDKVSQIWVYRWNRRYPSDRKFPQLKAPWHRVATEEFVGNSHPTITEEVYER